MADRTLKRNDTWPVLRFRCKQTNPATGLVEAIDLTTATAINVFLKQGATLITGLAVKDPDQVTNKGWADYTWASADTSLAGTYQFESQVTWPGGPPTRITTFPSSGYKEVVVELDLGP